LVAGPVYSATKAAMHNFTMSLRFSLQLTTCRVVEIAPPAVKTNLGGSHAFGEDCDEFCENVMNRFIAGELEIGYKFSDEARVANRERQQALMLQLGSFLHVPQSPPNQ